MALRASKAAGAERDEVSYKRAVRDLVALSTMPAIWFGQRPLQIAEILCDVLLSMVRADLVYVRLRRDGAISGEAARVDQQPGAGRLAADIGRKLQVFLETAEPGLPAAIRNPSGEGQLRAVVAQLGQAGQGGKVLVACKSPRFPTEFDRVLISVATNQAALALREANLNEELRQQRERLHTVLEQMPSALIIAEAPSGRLLLANQRVEEILGRPVLLNGGPSIDFAGFKGFHSDGRPYNVDEWPLFRSLTAGETVRDEEIEYERQDGTRRLLSASSSPVLDGDLRIVAAVLTFHDLTERRRAEEQIRRQQVAIRELSIPVLQIEDRLLIVPLVGEMDTRRARQLTETLLAAIRKHRARAVVIDVTGIASLDSHAAGHLRQTVEAARLLGATVVISGISAGIAQALTSIGVAAETLPSAGDLQGGIEKARRRAGGSG